jgi:hypothetical protein
LAELRLMIQALTIQRMRPLEDLIVSEPDDAWIQVRAWQSASHRSVEILECRRADGEATLLAAQVTTRSPMGAIAFHSGGIQVDGGWLRFLGAGNERIGGGLREWNESLGGVRLDPVVGDALLVAYDALGGWFAINAGRWPDRLGGVQYLTPDAGGWQPLDLGYSGLLEWSMSDDLDGFYEGQRWPTWRAEAAALGPDEAIHIYPPLGFEATPVADRSRRAVPVRELWVIHHDIARQVANLPAGAQVKFHVET